MLEGGLFGSRQSVNNCFADNRFARSLPPDLSAFDCAYPSTPNPDMSTSRQIVKILVALHEELVSRHARAQPAPAPQTTMPNPRDGAPANPLCH
jgi:hypothetical protein